ncbi:MAG: SDR family NAD(P)-dependent oxidoreductase [Capsulimonadaceae bacterium]
MQIESSVIIVTGASSGIGLSTARLLAGRGARVALVARSAGVLESLAAELPGSLAVAADMTDFPAIRQAVRRISEHYGRVDGLVNNAGRAYDAAIEEIEPEVFDEIFHLNVLGPIVAMQVVIPHMRRRGGGSIVNINSGTALMRIPRYSVYSSSKRALVGISLTAREELARDNIAVSQVYPSVTATHFGANKMVAPPAGTSGRPEPRRDYSDGDSPEYIAEIIAKAIEEGGAEYFAHEGMRLMDNRR